MEIIKQIGISLLLTVQATFWFVKLLIAKLFWFVQKNILVLVLIFLAGCEKSVGPVDDCSSTLDMYCNLQKQGSHYLLEWDDNHTQTFASIYVDVGDDEIYKIGFASDVQVNVAGQWLDLVNKASYTREDGTTQTTLGVFAEQINNVVNIYGGYTDNCGVRHQSQLSVKVVNNF